MGEICARMNREVLGAFMDDDAGRAREIAAMDEEVDALHEKTQRDLFAGMIEDEAYLSQALQFNYVGRYLERYADHITNISEWIVYGRTGNHVDLNR
jgi:phosphate transport system protein